MQPILYFALFWAALTLAVYRRHIRHGIKLLFAVVPHKVVWRRDDGCPLEFVGEFLRLRSVLPDGWHYFCPRCETQLTKAAEVGGRKAVCRACWIDYGDLPEFVDPAADVYKKLIADFPQPSLRRQTRRLKP